MRLLLFISALVSLHSYAQDKHLKSCSDMTSEDQSHIGFQCTVITSGPNYNREFLWERVVFKNFGEAWQVTFDDGSKGPIWSGKIGTSINVPQATTDKNHPISDSEASILCQNAGGKLPSKGDFNAFHFSGNFIFNPRPKQSDIIYPGSGPYWTSTIYEYDFIGYHGAYIYYPQNYNTQFAWDNFDKEHSVICISEQ